jgi:UDP-N-acetylglucosamine diphosphorylase / glucose-1-phosphate thymidylyltransferase / UDP-N-acetylgalactosamine diphosphorylase / glucosamine-1-phosphate N-acetyltransferase / galactosamine-1-phosphate N-acetyltransferase
LMEAVILAAGSGSKMWPYGVVRPKTMLPVTNRPLLGHSLETLKSLGFEKIYVAAGPLSEQIRYFCRDHAGVRVVDVSGSRGSADSLSRVLPLLEGASCLVLYGDIFTHSSSLYALMEDSNHGEANAFLTVPLGEERGLDWLCLEMSGGKATRFLAHPRQGATHRLGGAFVFNREMFPFIDNCPGSYEDYVQVGAMPPLERDLMQSLGAFLAGGGQLKTVETRSVCIDLDKPWHLLEANEAALSSLFQGLDEDLIGPGCSISEKADIQGRIVLGEGSRIGPGVVVKGDLWVGRNTILEYGAILDGSAVVGDGVIIRNGCIIDGGSVIGHRCIVQNGAQVGGLVMDGAYLYHYMGFWGIIGQNSDLGAGTVCGTLRFDDQLQPARVKYRREPGEKRTNLVYLGDYCRTGVGAVLMPGSKTGPYSIVGPGVVLNGDLPDNTLLQVRQDVECKAWGPERYGW